METIVFVRHGEKPAADLGQLNLQGLNRALALPNVLIPKYGKADAVFAPGTRKKLTKNGVQYSYVRPLVTIEPTAIRLGLPVEAQIGYDDINGLRRALLQPRYEHSLIFVAWEHRMLQETVKKIVSSLGGDPAVIPEWPKGDFDSIYVIRIQSDGGKRSVTFRHDHEGLDGQSLKAPKPRGA